VRCETGYLTEHGEVQSARIVTANHHGKVFSKPKETLRRCCSGRHRDGAPSRELDPDRDRRAA